jgi:hypothetical protein
METQQIILIVALLLLLINVVLNVVVLLKMKKEQEPYMAPPAVLSSISQTFNVVTNSKGINFNLSNGNVLRLDNETGLFKATLINSRTGAGLYQMPTKSLSFFPSISVNGNNFTLTYSRGALILTSPTNSSPNENLFTYSYPNDANRPSTLTVNSITPITAGSQIKIK